METLVQRLVQNPHDQDAITYAHQAGQSDPRSYAMLLEKVGTATSDPAFSSHWLTEAANVWLTSLGDAHRAARALMIAIDRDPTQPLPAERLADLYREKGDTKALVALLERRAKALSALAQHDPALRQQVAQIHEELGRSWSEPPLSQPKKAVENYRRAIEYDPTAQYAIYALRELYKAHAQWADAIPLFELELRLVSDLERRVALLCDEAEVRRNAGDLAGATQAYRGARDADGGQDPGLKQHVAALVLQRMQAGNQVDPAEIEEAAALFVELAEQYPGEHGFSYSLCALELAPANDRAVQLAIYYGEQLGRVLEAAPKAAAYLKANPQGPLAADARRVVTQAMEIGGDDSLIEALGPAPGAGIEEQVQGLLEIAQALARKAKKNEAAAKYREVLSLDPDNTDAIAFLEAYYRQSRKFAELRDMLLAAAQIEDADVDQRRAWLKEVAVLCESQLRDPASAIVALKQTVALDPDDEIALGQLKRLLEKAGQWDELAEVLTREAEETGDVEARILLERSLAKLHEQRRKDPIATGETWARIAALAPDDEEAIWTSVGHFERGERLDLAARVIQDNVATISDEAARASLLERLGELRLALGEPVGAGEAFAEGASLVRSSKLWALAEKAFVQAESWDQAAAAVDEQAELATSNADKAAFYATESDYLARAGDEASAVLRLEQAAELDPVNDEYAAKLEARYEEAQRIEDLANFLMKRADALKDPAQRVALRKRAANIQRDALQNPEAARATLLALLDDGDEPEALAWLADDAQQNGDAESAVGYLARLVKVTTDPAAKVEVALREAALLADGLDDLEGALARYRRILEELDPEHPGVLLSIADLEERLGNQAATAEALEKRLALLQGTEEKLETAERLARLYEGPLDDPKAAIRVLDIVRELEPENFDAVQRLCELCEREEDWPRVADLLAELIEVEGDEEEVSRMTRRLAEILHRKVGKGDEALAALMNVGDQGDEACRTEYVRLGDELGWKGVVASKLVEWYADAPNGPERNEALRGAFDRFLAVGREADAASVALELARSRGADADIAQQLEAIAVKLKDLDALSVAHDLVAAELRGVARAEELVRQAEVLCQAGVDPQEAVQHGEQSLSSVPPAEVGPLLERLAAIASGPEAIVDIYERQVTRCKAPQDKLQALARAAQVAASHGAFDRARHFMDVALGGAVQEETLEVLEEAARTSDERLGGDKLRRTLAEALAAGGQGARDGGRTRSALLGRAAQIAHRDLKDTAQAFVWLGDAIVAHVDDERLDALEALAEEIGDPRRAEAVQSRALEEVFDGPLVRKLLARRAALRRNRLDDPVGAAADLKRLHDLSPSDTQVMEQLSALYTELRDYRGMVQLYEDQILRGKDPTSRAELARKVARLWEDELDDAREAADAWRRVLRMKPGDPEATEGLERAKSNMLKKKPEREPVSDALAAPPPASSAPARATSEAAPATTSEPAGAAESAASATEAPATESPATGADAADAAASDVARHPAEAAPESAPASAAQDGTPTEAAAADAQAPSTTEGDEGSTGAPSFEPPAVSGVSAVEPPAQASNAGEPGSDEAAAGGPEPAAAEAPSVPAPESDPTGLGVRRTPPAKPRRAVSGGPGPDSGRGPLPPPPSGSSRLPPPPAIKGRTTTPPPPPMSGTRPPPPPVRGKPPPPPGARPAGSTASFGPATAAGYGAAAAAPGALKDTDEEFDVDDDELLDDGPS